MPTRGCVDCAISLTVRAALEKQPPRCWCRAELQLMEQLRRADSGRSRVYRSTALPLQLSLRQQLKLRNQEESDWTLGGWYDEAEESDDDGTARAELQRERARVARTMELDADAETRSVIASTLRDEGVVDALGSVDALRRLSHMVGAESLLEGRRPEFDIRLHRRHSLSQPKLAGDRNTRLGGGTPPGPDLGGISKPRQT